MKEEHKTETKLFYIVSLILNLAVSAGSFYGTTISYSRSKLGMVEFYTIDSNLFAASACLLYAVFIIRLLVKGKEIPVLIAQIKYMAVCCLTVTFIVVVAVLAPMQGKDGYVYMMLKNDMLFHHFLSPVMIILSFICFDHVFFKASKAAAIALIPTIIYAVVLITLNLAHVVVGPYPFLRVYNQPWYMSVLWCIIIVGGAYGIAFLLAKLKNANK